MNFREICTLVGGPEATSRILGFKSSRYVRKVASGESPFNPKWNEALEREAEARIKSLKEFIKNKRLWVNPQNTESNSTF